MVVVRMCSELCSEVDNVHDTGLYMCGWEALGQQCLVCFCSTVVAWAGWQGNRLWWAGQATILDQTIIILSTVV